MNRIDRSMKRRRQAALMQQMQADSIYWISLSLVLTLYIVIK